MPKEPERGPSNGAQQPTSRGGARDELNRMRYSCRCSLHLNRSRLVLGGSRRELARMRASSNAPIDRCCRTLDAAYAVFQGKSPAVILRRRSIEDSEPRLWMGDNTCIAGALTEFPSQRSATAERVRELTGCSRDPIIKVACAARFSGFFYLFLGISASQCSQLLSGGKEVAR